MEEIEENYDLLIAVMVCLREEKTEDQHPSIRLLNLLFSTETEKNKKKKTLEQDFEIPITQELEREVSEMCNLSKGIEEKGIQQGIQQGMQQGEARINALNMILINAGRFEDLKRAVTDINYQSQLMKELLPKEI